MALTLAAALRKARARARTEPTRSLCPRCLEPVLLAVVHGRLIVADIDEWEPRFRCFPCAGAQATTKQGRVNCRRCGGTGYVGERRPRERMLAIDMAWGDDPHIRVIGPGTPRRAGEGLHRLHTCHRLDHSQNGSGKRSISGVLANAGHGPPTATGPDTGN